MHAAPILPFRAMSSPLDRLSAFLVDLMILTPVLTLLAAPFERWILIEQFAGDEAIIPLLMWLKIGVGAAFFFLYHALFWYVRRATPGEKFWKLQVCQYPSGTALTLGQACARSFWFSMCSACLGIPMLALWRHPLRRTFYDRVSDSVVRSSQFAVTLPPSFREQRQARVIQGSALVFLSAIIVMQVMVSYWDSAEYEGQCVVDRVIDHGSRHIDAREDVALAMFALKRIDERCLHAVGERLFEAKQTPLSLAALALTAEDNLKQEYRKYACSNAKMDLSCRTLKIFESWKDENWPRLDGYLANVNAGSPLYHRVLALQRAVERRQASKIEKILPLLPPSSTFLELRIKSQLQLAHAHKRGDEVDKILNEAKWFQSARQQVATIAWKCRWEMEDTLTAAPACDRLVYLSEQIAPRLIDENVRLTLVRWAEKSDGGEAQSVLAKKVRNDGKERWPASLKKRKHGLVDPGSEPDPESGKK